MTFELSHFQKRLCNRLQQGLPLVPQPFAEIAAALGSTEEQVLANVQELKEAGIIRRLSVMVNHRALGMSSTLVTAHVPAERLAGVTAAVNGLPGVSHNYLRHHHFNLWFTLQERSSDQIDARLRELGLRFDIEFHSLPVTYVFKLDVRFDTEGQGEVTLQDVENVPSSEPVAVSDEHRAVLAALQRGVPVASFPFAGIEPDGVDEAAVLPKLRELVDLGVVRRIAVVLNHRRLGFTANVMFAGQVAPEHVVEAGKTLARFSTVSHCYERRTFEGWPYNLFAMMHAHSMGQIQHTVDGLAKKGHLISSQLLPTEAELKKQPVRHDQL